MIAERFATGRQAPGQLFDALVTLVLPVAERVTPPDVTVTVNVTEPNWLIRLRHTPTPAPLVVPLTDG